MDTKNLRQKILDLAIRGKLVPQDPNDEPASVLLEQIKAEKERLIKEGKIKRSKKSTKTSDTPHYENVPFEIPSSWEWTTINDISKSILYGVSESAKTNGKYRLLRITDIQNNSVQWDSVPYTDFDENKAKSYLLSDGDILFARTGATVGKSYLVQGLTEEAIYASYLIRVQTYDAVLPQYLKFYFESGYYWEQIEQGSVGVGQPNVNGTILGNLHVPIPPIHEQFRIVSELSKWMGIIDIIENSQTDLQALIKQTKSKILDLAIHGKLVPQDPNDEPALDLLKRINPDFTPCDNGHYPQLPDGWCKCRLEDIVEYEQPQAYIVNSTDYDDRYLQAYIVNSTDYDDRYLTPVLTAGKSFVIGYTNETEGIYQNTPCIIFDDFTTDSKLVDFPFKVKSSAMKILKVAADIEIEYVAMFMNITRLIGDTHKRYWISEYSKLCIPIPPKEEQKRIINAANAMFEKLDAIMESL